MKQQFYIAVDGKQTGPFTLDELKIKNLNPNTLVWTEGFQNWTKASEVPLLKEFLRVVPPPIPSDNQFSVPPPPVPPTNLTNNHFGYKLARRRDRFFATLLEGIIIWIPLTIIMGEEQFNDPYSFTSILSWLVIAIIFGAILYPIWSGNLGHKIMGLKVISAEDGSDQNKAGAGALREGLKSIFGIIILPVIWVLWDDDRQNLYDKVVKTIVVKKS
jgi:uncharacterized RDD family membrane protein YckC